MILEELLQPIELAGEVFNRAVRGECLGRIAGNVLKYGFNTAMENQGQMAQDTLGIVGDEIRGRYDLKNRMEGDPLPKAA